MKEADWESIKSKHKFRADELISTLQKSIRRHNEESALFCCYEMMVSGEKFEDKLWQRLRVISVEDVGLASLFLVNTVYVLHQNYLYLKGKEDRFLQAMLATLLLVRSAKSRYVDELYNNLKFKIENENYRLKIPDYALDVHTKRGKKMKRGLFHFWTVGAQLKNDLNENEKKHFEEIVRRLSKKSK